MREIRTLVRWILAAAPVAILLAAPACASGIGESQRLVNLMRLEPGMVAADVGAGDGDWTEALSKAVGPEGHVFATEVEAKLVAELAGRIEDRALTNVTAVLGDQFKSGLPTECCDAVLLRMVYHHFQDPQAMRASLRQALRPGGLVAIVDINPQRHWRQLEGVPERGGHGIPPEALIDEMTADGFAVVSRDDEWNGNDERYCIVFRRAPKTP